MAIVLLLIWMHFVADFIFQTDKMAINKSTSHAWLASHVTVYSLPFLVFGLKFALINAVAHYITDAISSRLTSYYWRKTNRHMFFVVVGADQAIHMTTLVLTYALLIGF